MADDVRTVTLAVEPLTPEAWRPFGQVVGADDLVIELRGDEVFHLDVLHYERKPFRCDHLNRHHRATQALVPLGGEPAVVVVAPPEVDFSVPEHLDTVRAFLISGKQGINLALGTWHWGPYPVGPVVDLVNLQGKFFPSDNEVAHLERDLGVVFAVAL